MEFLRRLEAMGTVFELLLVGEDERHLSAVAEAAVEEIVRIERLLSFFDPKSEVSRINRQAGAGPVRVDEEVFAILSTCDQWRDRTNGYFDILAASTDQPADDRDSPDRPRMMLDDASRTVRVWNSPAVINLGGFGKGYALDRVGTLLMTFGVESALAHGGTSSVLALGVGPAGEGWPIGLRDPFVEGAELTQVVLKSVSLSCSTALGDGEQLSDLVVPQEGRRLTQQAACVVIGPSGEEAEFLSTAIACMGKERAIDYTQQMRDILISTKVGWIDRVSGSTELTWLTEAP